MKELKILIRIDELGNKTLSAKESNGFNPKSIEDQYEILGILEVIKSKQLRKIEEMTKVVRINKGK